MLVYRKYFAVCDILYHVLFGFLTHNNPVVLRSNTLLVSYNNERRCIIYLFIVLHMSSC